MPAAPPYARSLALPALGSPLPTKAPAKHSRNRSASSSSHGSSSSKSLPPFPAVATASESILEQNASDILWKTFVAYEQDCRETQCLLPLSSQIEQTVSAAVEPISLAGDALLECATCVQNEVRHSIEQALAGASAGLGTNSACDNPRPSSTASHSKQLTLASTRLSGSCSTFRATQTALRCYGGARKTAYQLDLFIHKYALPTSTALHKRGQEFSAVSKWLKKVLGSDDRILDAGEMAALRKASNALNTWAEGLVAHAEIMKAAAQHIRSIITERASLNAYTFPPRASSVPEAVLPETTNVAQPLLQSPLSTYTDLSSYSPSLEPASSQSQSPELLPYTLAPPVDSTTSQSAPSAYTFYDFESSLNTPLSTLMPQSCAFTYAAAPSIFEQTPQYQSYGQQSPFTFPTSAPGSDLNIPSELFFDGLCM